jgi:hypothetical protein
MRAGIERGSDGGGLVNVDTQRPDGRSPVSDVPSWSRGAPSNSHGDWKWIGWNGSDSVQVRKHLLPEDSVKVHIDVQGVELATAKDIEAQGIVP